MKFSSMPLVLLLPTIAACGGTDPDSSVIPESLWRQQEELNIEPLLGCYRESGGLTIKLGKDAITTDRAEYAVEGYFRGKNFNYVLTKKELFLDTDSSTMRVRRDNGFKLEVINQGDASEIVFFNEDSKQVFFRRSNCDR